MMIQQICQLDRGQEQSNEQKKRMTLPASENEFDRRQINPIIGDDDVGQYGDRTVHSVSQLGRKGNSALVPILAGLGFFDKHNDAQHHDDDADQSDHDRQLQSASLEQQAADEGRRKSEQPVKRREPSDSLRVLVGRDARSQVGHHRRPPRGTDQAKQSVGDY